MKSKEPLAETVVLLTRGQEDADPLRRELERLGATVVEEPLIRIEPPATWAPLDQALERLGNYHWITFTSRNAVWAVFGRLHEMHRSGQLPTTLRVAAVGNATAQALQSYGVEIDLCPEQSGAEALTEAMIARGMRGKHVLAPGGNLARSELRDRLQAAGARVDSVEVYRTVRSEVTPEVLSALRRGEIDMVTLASPSAVHNLAAALGSDVSILRSLRLVCIGPTTAQALRELEVQPRAIADQPTLDGLLRAIVQLRSMERSND